jgi:spermidine synthase
MSHAAAVIPYQATDSSVWSRRIFTASVILSATLLFALQPMFARMVLPTLGGTPMVWSVATVVYQSVLLGGYAAAAAIGPRLAPGTLGAVHVGLMLIAAATCLPFTAPTEGASSIGGLLWVFLTGVSLPFFTLSVNSPLLQHWFARSDDPQAHDPYFLYAASNAGSLLALLTYPFLVEPWIPLSVQAWAWKIGYLTLAALLAITAYSIRHAPPLPHVAEEIPDVSTLVGWTALAALPSALLVAQTAALSTDITPAPFIWVLPLAVYMTTWMVAFSERWCPEAETLARLQVIGVAFGLTATAAPLLGLIAVVVLTLTANFLISLACHARLRATRPPAAMLGAFYMCTSLGGVIGSVTVGLVAPLVLSGPWEHLIVYAIAASGTAAAHARDRVGWIASWIAAGAAGWFITSTLSQATTDTTASYLFRAMVGLGILAIGLSQHRRVLAIACAGLVSGALVHGEPDTTVLYRARSLFGSYRVTANPDGTVAFVHGTTVHGLGLADDNGQPRAVGYHYSRAPITQTIETSRAVLDRPVSVATVGLGAGNMACLKRPDETWTYFEIDQIVVDIAKDTRLFRYMSRCDPEGRVVVGDGRLTLDKDADSPWDIIVMDAFTSDAVPSHLITREAIEMYKRHLKPGGVIIIQASNRHVDLRGAVAATAAAVGLSAVTRDDIPSAAAHEAEVAMASRVITVSANEAILKTLEDQHQWKRLSPPDGLKAWTDDHTNVLLTLIGH